MLDEVEQALVGMLGVVDHPDHRVAVVAEPLEEGGPGGEQVVPAETGPLVQTDQGREPWSQPVALALVGDELGQPLLERRCCGVAGVGLDEPEAGA